MKSLSVLYFSAIFWSSAYLKPISIGVIVPTAGPSDRISQLVSEAVSSHASYPVDVEIIWIRTYSTSTAGAVTESWSKYKFIALIGSMGRCVTQLELAASLNISAFTWNCPANETATLRSDLYWSHTRLDMNPMSLVPYIRTLYLNPELLTDQWARESDSVIEQITLTSTSSTNDDVVQLMAKDLMSSGISCHWCSTNCNASSADKFHLDDWCPNNCSALATSGGVLVVYTQPSQIGTWLKAELYNQRAWMAVVIVMDQPLPSSHTIDWEILKEMKYNNKLFLIQPNVNSQHASTKQGLPIDEAAYYDSTALFLTAYTQTIDSVTNPHSLTNYNRSKNIASYLQSTCYTSITGEKNCLDSKNWDLGRFSIYRYSTSPGSVDVPIPCSLQQSRVDYNTSVQYNRDQGSFLLQGSFVPAGKDNLIQLNTDDLSDCLNVTDATTISSTDRKNLASKMATTGALIALCITLSLILVVGMLIFLYYKLGCHRRGKSTSSPSWLISSTDITPFREQPEDDEFEDRLDAHDLEIAFRVSGCSSVTDFGYYKDQAVVLKRWCSNGVLLTKAISKELELMVGLHHENLATFYGVCMGQSDFVLVNEYCIKGSLEEILQYEPVNLDETFAASLLSDIIKGMTFLHKSSVGCHGSLKSSNCLVTARWVVKLSDFGLPQVRSLFKTARELLWCAPEVLRRTEVASQKADVYAFGIILYELVGKSGPFGAGYNYSDKDLQVIIDKVAHKEYGPETSWLCCEDYLKNIMISCWQNPPKLRPDFVTLSDHLKPFKAVLNGRSMVDNILTMMERYQMSLEELVDDRTSQLMAEKRKTENLLHRMLPPQVAEQLVKGKPVDPESFTCITVCFADICGFTNLASASTPFQVISLLNELYTMFDIIIRHYDVYKVETVGDAYLCVSGLPKPNGDQHATEIALMALEFMKTLRTFRSEQNLVGDQKLKMRIGIHSGPCVAGVVGVSMPRYTLFGDTVNVASRLETTSEPMKIQISTTTKQLLEKVGGFYFEERGYVHLKGKGDMETHWLTGVRQSAGSAVPGRHTTNLDSLNVPGKSNSKINGSIMSGLDILTSPESSAKYKHHRRTGSARSEIAMQLVDSFRRGERSKSMSKSLGSRSVESLSLGASRSTLADNIPMITVSDNEQVSLLYRDNSLPAQRRT